MVDPIADKLAEQSLELHAREGTFIVAIHGEEEGAALADAFLQRGCTVEPEPFRLELRVTAPKAPALNVLQTTSVA